VIRYPTIGLSAARSLVLELLNGSNPDIGGHVVIVGADDDANLDLSELEKVGHDATERVATLDENGAGTAERDALEGELSIALYRALDPTSVPLEILDDAGFWRYVGVLHLWSFVRWREPAIVPGADWSKIAPYLDGRQASECVALRMFVRASIAHEAGNIDLASTLKRATDFWRSHLVRVGTGAVPPLARAFVEAQERDRLAPDPVRAVARKINRTRTNVLMHGYTSDVAEEFVRTVW
jgi:hypothetical protein